jgi:polyisoprenoid-binding protein YceI
MVRIMKKSLISASAAVIFGLAAILQADAQMRYNAQARGSSVRVDGTSTAHDWEMEGGMIGGYLEFGAGVTLDKAQAAPSGIAGDKVPSKAHVIIPIGTIHSKAEHLPEVMDDLMQKSMKAADFPRIEFALTDMTFKGPHEAGTPFDMEVTGDLVIAGATNKVTFPITIEPQDEGKIKVSGSAPVKMTAYGITPPAPVLAIGTLRCGDDVKISFDWILKEKK